MQNPDNKMPIIFRLFWIAPILAGAMLLLSAGKNHLDGEASAGWNPAQATIIRIGGKKTFLTSQRWGSYRWMHNGQEYIDSEVDCCGSKWDHYLDAAGEKEIGDTVTIYLDPENPARAVLMTGTGWRCLMPALGGIALMALGLWLRQRITNDAVGDNRGF